MARRERDPSPLVDTGASASALGELASGAVTWGILFWVALMAGGGDPATIDRWKELAKAVPDRRVRGDLGQIALVLAELAGCYLAWEKALEGWEMTESKVVNRWIEKAEERKELETRREVLFRLLNQRFPGQVSNEAKQTIDQQPSVSMLQAWFDEASTVATIEDFVAVLRR